MKTISSFALALAIAATTTHAWAANDDLRSFIKWALEDVKNYPRKAKAQQH